MTTPSTDATPRNPSTPAQFSESGGTLDETERDEVQRSESVMDLVSDIGLFNIPPLQAPAPT